MCLGNRAEVSSHYINGQLRLLYENAQHCVEKHGTGLKPAASAVEYATCLYEFYGPGKRHQNAQADLAFFAKFGCPRLEYVCNHEVVLFLELVDGHYNLDYNKLTLKRELNESIEDCTLAFRITFDKHVIENIHCAAIGNAAHYTSILHVLNMGSAIFLPEHSDLPGLGSHNDDHAHYSRERKLTALTHYLTKFYLPTLKRAGHHVLHSLPDFDNLSSTSAHIDYSVISTRSLATDTVFGIRVEDINRFLRGLWLEAASCVDEYGLSDDTISKCFLAEVRIPSPHDGEDMHLHMRFGPLHVQPLCKREVVLYLSIQDVNVHYGSFNDQSREHLKDWKLAFIVDIGFEEVGSSKRIKLNMSSARFCEHLSFFGEHFHDIEVYTRVKTILIEYITTQYISIIETTETVVIFRYDTTIHGEVYSEEDESGDEPCGVGLIDVDGCTCEDEGSCGHTGGIRWGVIQRDIITHTHSSEFDLVTALTQGSINAHFKSLWESARRRISGSKSIRTWESAELELNTCLSNFSFVHSAHDDEIFFSASFSAPKVQLICKEGSHKAIFYLHLSEGYLKTLGSGKSLQPGSHAHSFSDWRLAFEVDLKIIDSREDTMPACIIKRLGLEGPTGLKQLVLALSTAKLNLSLSTVPGLLDGEDYRAIRARREALVYYIQTCYFPVFKRAHHHVLYTLPRSIPSAHHHHHHTLTSLRFEIVPFSYAPSASHLEGLFGRYSAIFERNSIVIMGMTRGRPLPSCSLPRGHNWICGYGKEVPYGTVCLSRKSFLEEILLSKLEKINRETTIVPAFSGIKDGMWVLELAAWDDHKMKAATACNWREVTKKSSCEHLEFEWKNRELWRYEHDNDFDINGLYTVSCHTHNVLTIPTSRSVKPTSTISLKGSVKMNLKYEGEGPDWSSETIAHWSTNIVFNTSSSGLQISLQPARIIPEFHTTYASHATHGAGRDTQEQAIAQLKEKFPDFIDFAVLLNDLKAGLEGMWAGVQMHSHELCVARPVFTRHGDLLLELAVRGQHSESHLNGKRSVMGLNGSATPVHANGNGHGTNETWFRHVIHKAGDAVSAYSPSISRMSSSMSSTSKTTSTSFVSQETITRQSSSVEVSGNGNGNGHANGNGEVEEFSDSDDGESDL